MGSSAVGFAQPSSGIPQFVCLSAAAISTRRAPPRNHWSCTQKAPSRLTPAVRIARAVSPNSASIRWCSERYLPQFQELRAIRMGLSSGGRSPGLATVAGIFSYCGKHFQRYEAGEWVTTHGWLDLRRYRFPAPLGARWLGSCDVPDLELVPRRYPTLLAARNHGPQVPCGASIALTRQLAAGRNVLRGAMPCIADGRRIPRAIRRPGHQRIRNLILYCACMVEADTGDVSTAAAVINANI
jgi:hypothetical protein